MNIATPKILISNAHVDLGYAKKIYDDLKRYSLDVWLSPSRTGIRNRCCPGMNLVIGQMGIRVYGLSKLGKWINKKDLFKRD